MSETCDGIGCDNSAPAPGRDGLPQHGWIELRVDDEAHRFCSWSCLASFVGAQQVATAGD